MAEARLHTVVCATKNVPELARFHRGLLELSDRERDVELVGFKIADIYLGFDQIDVVTPRGAVWPWFAFDDLTATFERALGLGATARTRPATKPWGARIASVLDPAGNVLGLTDRHHAGA